MTVAMPIDFIKQTKSQAKSFNIPHFDREESVVFTYICEKC